MQFYNGGVVLVQECQAALIGYALWDSAPTSCGYDLLLATMQGQVDYVKKEFGIQVSYVTAIVCPTQFLMLLEFFFTNKNVELREEFYVTAIVCPTKFLMLLEFSLPTKMWS